MGNTKMARVDTGWKLDGTFFTAFRKVDGVYMVEVSGGRREGAGGTGATIIVYRYAGLNRITVSVTTCLYCAEYDEYLRKADDLLAVAIKNNW